MSEVTEKQMQLYDRMHTLITSFCMEQDITLVEVAGIIGVLLQEVNETISSIDYGECGSDDDISSDGKSSVV